MCSTAGSQDCEASGGGTKQGEEFVPVPRSCLCAEGDVCEQHEPAVLILMQDKDTTSIPRQQCQGEHHVTEALRCKAQVWRGSYKVCQ